MGGSVTHQLEDDALEAILERSMLSTETLEEECTHHWIISFEVGIDSLGRCKKCGTEHRFANAYSDKMWRTTPCRKCGQSNGSFKHRKECKT